MRWLAFTANKKPGGVASTQFCNVEAEGNRRNV